MASYSLNDLIGKTIVAKGDVNLYRLPSDSAPIEYTVKPNNSVGVVDSYLLPTSGRAYVYLMFYDTNKRPYYMRWGSAINTSSLLNQGVKSDETKAAEAAAANKPFNLADFIQKNITLVVVTLAAVALAKTGIQTYSARKQ